MAWSSRTASRWRSPTARCTGPTGRWASSGPTWTARVARHWYAPRGRTGSPWTSVAAKMYWTDYGANMIRRADLDGSGIEDVVVTSLDNPYGIALDVEAGKIYWTDAGTEKIQRANLDGSDVEDLVIAGLLSPPRHRARHGRRQAVLGGPAHGQDPARRSRRLRRRRPGDHDARRVPARRDRPRRGSPARSTGRNANPPRSSAPTSTGPRPRTFSPTACSHPTRSRST